MAYIFYTVVFGLFLSATVLYFTRTRWLHFLPYSVSDFSLSDLRSSNPLYTAIPSSFNADIEDGLTSEDFDLQANIAGGDSRAGLDDVAKKEITKL